MGEETAAPEYRIRTVTDFLKVPEDRRATCLREFGVWLSLGQATQDLMEGLPVKWPTTFVWLDDDKHHAVVTMRAGKERHVLVSGKMREFRNG